MAIQDKPTLKSYFETGDKPTESNFEDLIDSLRHVDDFEVSDDAYDESSWNGDHDAPTKNAVRDKFASTDTALATKAELGTAQTFTQLQTFSSDIALSSAKGIKDANSVYLVKFPSVVSSAVNYFGISNSATGNDISIGADPGSSDSNVNVLYSAKGSGVHKFNAGISLLDSTYKSALDVSSTNTLRIANGFTTLRVPATVTAAAALTITCQNAFNIQSNGSSVAVTATPGFVVNGSTVSNSSGNFAGANITKNFSASNSSANLSVVVATTTINQQGTSNGTINAYEIALTPTSVLGSFRGYYSSIPATATSGSGTMYSNYHSGTAPSYFNHNITIGGTSVASSATNSVHVYSGTAPSGSITDGFVEYSEDITAGNAAPHFRTENGDVIKLYKQTNTTAIDSLLQNNGMLATGGSALFDNDIKVGVAGKGLYVKEGSNATMGTATLSGGTITVNTTKVTANSRIMLTVQSLGTVSLPQPIGVTARSAGTSFTITSADNTDTSIVSWIIIEPA